MIIFPIIYLSEAYYHTLLITVTLDVASLAAVAALTIGSNAKLVNT